MIRTLICVRRAILFKNANELTFAGSVVGAMRRQPLDQSLESPSMDGVALSDKKRSPRCMLRVARSDPLISDVLISSIPFLLTPIDQKKDAERSDNYTYPFLPFFHAAELLLLRPPAPP